MMQYDRVTMNCNPEFVIRIPRIAAINDGSQDISFGPTFPTPVIANNPTLVDLGKQLLAAAREGHVDVVKKLMNKGAPFTSDWLGNSPLHFAVMNGHLPVVNMLLRAGISRDGRSKVDKTPLHLAAQEGYEEIAQLLLAQGADVDAMDMLRMTPLHWAAEGCCVNIVEMLLKYNASTDVVSKFDKRPIDIAAEKRNHDIVEMLRSASKYKDSSNVLLDDPQLTHFVSAMTEDAVKSITAPSNDVLSDENIGNNNNDFASDFSSVFGGPDDNFLMSKTKPPKKKARPVRRIPISGIDETTNREHQQALETLEALTGSSFGSPEKNSVGLKILEAHGITMIPTDDSTLLQSALEGGQSVSLTEAGKLALNIYNKKEPVTPLQPKPVIIPAPSSSISSTSSTPPKKPMRIITVTKEQLAALTGAKNRSLVIKTDNVDSSGKPSVKKVKIESIVTWNSIKAAKPADSPAIDIDRVAKEDLAKQLEQAMREMQKYKNELREKESEAEEYKKKLASLTSK